MEFQRTNTTPYPGTDPMALPMPLGQVLLERGLVTQEALDQALASQKSDNRGRLIGELLVEQGAVELRLVVVPVSVGGLPLIEKQTHRC